MINQENFTLILNLLEKAEQILSIINLSDNAIGKYNQLKQLTYEKLGLDFIPLSKRPTAQTKALPIDLSQKLFNQGMKKSLLIELVFEYINRSTAGLTECDTAFFLGELDSIFKLNPSNSYEEMDYEVQVQEKKLKELFCQADAIFNRKIPSNRELINSYECQLIELKDFYEKGHIISNDKVAQLEHDVFTLRKENEINNFVLIQMNQMVSNGYEKYYPKNASWYGQEKFDSEYPDLDKVNFILCLLNKFYTDNKYLSDLVPNLQRDKLALKEENNLPYVQNVIEKNYLMKDIINDLGVVEKENELLHRNFADVMSYINKNIEGKIN